MESYNKIYCYLHMGGELIKDDDMSVEYKDGKLEGLVISCGMTY